MSKAIAQMPTTVGPKTSVGTGPFEREIRETVACVMVRFPTKVIEAAGDLSDEGVRLLKNQRRTLSVPTLLKLAKASGELGPAMWSAICQLAGRPNGNPELESPQMNAMYGALHMLAKSKGPAGEFARAMVRQMNGVPDIEPEPAPKPRIVTEQIVLDAWRLQDLREDRDRNYHCKITEDLFERKRA